MTAVRAVLEGRVRLDDLSDAEQDVVFTELAQVFEAPTPAVSAAYAELGVQRRAAQASRKTRSTRAA